MKTTTIIATAIALALTAGAASATGKNNGGNATAIAGAKASSSATARQSQGQHQGQLQGQLQGQSQDASNSNSINIENPWATLGVVLGSSNNSPCGRTFFGIPASGHNCTVRQEAAAIYSAMAPAYGEKKAARAATYHLCANDRTLRNTLVAIGVCTVKK